MKKVLETIEGTCQGREGDSRGANRKEEHHPGETDEAQRHHSVKRSAEGKQFYLDDEDIRPARRVRISDIINLALELAISNEDFAIVYNANTVTHDD